MLIRVLIVDDDTGFRRMMRKVLALRGYDVAGEAATLAEARVAIRETSPDAVLLDVTLPDGNGILFAEELTSDPRVPRVVLTSTDPEAGPAGLVRRCGAAGFIAKTELVGTDLGPYLG
jgi:DNA-binding NarL/FixJ family response regulator